MSYNPTIYKRIFCKFIIQILDKTFNLKVQESALLRVSVNAGLQLVFSLLQNSSYSTSPGSQSLVIDTLNVALTTLLSLTPLSLSQTNTLGNIGSECLEREGLAKFDWFDLISEFKFKCYKSDQISWFFANLLEKNRKISWKLDLWW